MVSGGSAEAVLPRPSDALPDGLEITSASISGGQCDITLRNSGRKTVVLNSQVVLAELCGSDTVTALVGRVCSSTIDIQGVSTSCLRDSGSQVSTVSETFYNTHLSDVPLEKLDTLLTVKGAGGHSVPYLGYVRVAVTLPDDAVGVGGTVNTLFLVCPDTAFSGKVPILIGTNALRLFAEGCEQRVGKHFRTVLPLSAGMAFMYTDLDQGDEGCLGSVKLRTQKIVIPAGDVVE
ncbi:hypothetical protein BaRGS_00013635, partial [Batillaria attramentaria]